MLIGPLEGSGSPTRAVVQGSSSINQRALVEPLLCALPAVGDEGCEAEIRAHAARAAFDSARRKDSQ